MRSFAVPVVKPWCGLAWCAWLEHGEQVDHVLVLQFMNIAEGAPGTWAAMAGLLQEFTPNS